MEILLFFVLIYAAKRGWDDARGAWRKSRSAYMTRADRNHPHMPEAKRAGHAVRHDLGYAASQVRHGFPQARHGFAEGWHKGRQAHDQARAASQKAKTERIEGRARLIPDLRDYRRRQQQAMDEIRRQEQGEGSEGSGGGKFEPVLLTGRSKSGRPLNPLSGEPEDSAAVWDQEDLDRRLAAAAEDPDIDVTTRPLRDPGDNREDTPEEPSGQQQEGTQPDPPGRQETPPGQPGKEDGNMSETTYQSVKSQMDTAETEAEQYAAEAEQSETVTEEHTEQARQAKERGTAAAEEMQSMEVDAETLSAMADHLQALDDAEKHAGELNDQMTQLKEAWQRVQETAGQVKSQMDASGHGALDEAHANAAAGGAQKPFYAD